MTVVNRLIVVFGLILLGTTLTFAQSGKIEKIERPGKAERIVEKKSATERAQLRAEKLSETLELTAEQQAKVEALELKYAKSGEVARKRQQERMKAQKEAVRQNRATTKEMHDKELKAILSAEQAEKYDIIQAERKAKVEARRADMRVRGAELKGKRSKLKARPNRQ